MLSWFLQLSVQFCTVWLTSLYSVHSLQWSLISAVPLPVLWNHPPGIQLDLWVHTQGHVLSISHMLAVLPYGAAHSGPAASVMGEVYRWLSIGSKLHSYQFRLHYLLSLCTYFGQHGNKSQCDQGCLVPWRGAGEYSFVLAGSVVIGPLFRNATLFWLHIWKDTTIPGSSEHMRDTIFL